MNLKKPKFWDYNTLSIWSIILIPFTFTYLLIFWIIKIIKPSKKFKIPIICVGNIYLGGTGKTPLSIEIFNILKNFNKNPAFVKKPYLYLEDEIKMLKASGKVFTEKKRASSISLSINDNHDVVILDDGFQDFSIKPDIAILCFNSKQLIGNGLVIPSGPLRENLSSIKRADCVVINGSESLSFEKKLKKINSSIKVFYSNYKIKNLDRFQDKEVVAFAGIGNPQNFFDLLKENNIKLKETFSFPDHHNYSLKDFNNISKGKEDVILLTTKKDYFRIKDKKKNLYCLEVDLEIKDKDSFINLIKNKL